MRAMSSSFRCAYTSRPTIIATLSPVGDTSTHLPAFSTAAFVCASMGSTIGTELDTRSKFCMVGLKSRKSVGVVRLISLPV